MGSCRMLVSFVTYLFSLRRGMREERWERRTATWPSLLTAVVRSGQPHYLPNRAAVRLRKIYVARAIQGVGTSIHTLKAIQ